MSTITSNIKGILRSYPLMFTIIAIILSLVYKLNSLVFLIILISITSIVNKLVSKPLLFKLLDILDLKHIALRPSGCVNSSNFINELDPTKLSTTYGMPSGHSVESMLISVFLVMYILKYHTNTKKRSLLIGFIILIGCGVCYSRVLLGCHTIPQIIIGGIIGSLCGYYGFKLWDKLNSAQSDHDYKFDAIIVK